MINSSVYIFGKLNGGYTQYPDDYAKEVYQNLYANASSKSQIVIHRDKDLMYYGYVRKLDNDSQYIGFCVLLNGIMFSNISSLFPIFESAVTELVSNGDILSFNERGEIISRIDSLVEKQNEVTRISSVIRNGIDGMEAYTKSLPSVSYSIANTEKKVFAYSDSNDIIVEASCKYAYTYITKEKNYNTSSLLGYQSVIKKLYREKGEITSQYIKLKNQYDKLNKQKKQYRNVIILCVIVVLCGIGIYFLKYTLSNTQQTLEMSQNENTQKGEKIKDLNTKLTTLNGDVKDLKYSLDAEKTQRVQIEEELDSLTNIYKDKQPLFIKSTSFDFNTGWFTFDYYGYYAKDITLVVRAFNNDESYSRTTSLSVEKGHHTSSIYISDNLSSSQWYSFELLIGNRIIGGDRH